MSTPREHKGGCHCGKVRYEATFDLTHPVIACNCSMCGRSGTLLAFVPDGSFKLLSGEDNLTDYQFGKKRIHHLFCKTCGIKSFARAAGKDGPTVAVNTRCLDEVSLDGLAVKNYDGKSV